MIRRAIAWLVVFAIMIYVLCKVEVRIDPFGIGHLFYDGEEVHR